MNSSVFQVHYISGEANVSYCLRVTNCVHCCIFVVCATALTFGPNMSFVYHTQLHIDIRALVLNSQLTLSLMSCAVLLYINQNTQIEQKTILEKNHRS